MATYDPYKTTNTTTTTTSKKKYNPYDDVKAIVDLKAMYNTGKATGDPNYKQYQEQAVPYYNNLVANEMGNTSDWLASVDYDKANEYLSTLTPSRSYDDFYESLTSIASGDTTPSNPEYEQWRDDLMGISTGKTQITPTQEASDLLDMVKANDSFYNDRYNEIHNNGLSNLDALLNYDYTQQSYYQPIMDSYNLYGQNAANGALASGAASNGGNIDSYAAANANRQQLAFTNAGHQAALAAAAQNKESYLDLYNALSGNLSDLRLKNADIQSTYKDTYTTDADNRKAAMNTVAGLYNTDSAERKHAVTSLTDQYLADLGLVQNQYVTDSEERMNTANNEHDLAVQRLANEYGVTVAQMEAALEGTKAQLQYESDLAGYAADKYVAEQNRDATINAAGATANAEKYSALKDYEADVYKANAEKAIAGIEEEIEGYDADTIARVLVNDIKTGVNKDVSSWDEFQKYLAQVAAIPASEAKKLRESWEDIDPNLFS